MRCIGVLVQKGPNATEPPRAPDPEYHRWLLKELYNAIGKPAPWELTSTDAVPKTG
jgi:hypothetical protein